jgi:hypothetical protein
VLRSGALSASAGNSISIDGVAQLPKWHCDIISRTGLGYFLTVEHIWHCHIRTLLQCMRTRLIDRPVGCRTVTLQTRDEHGLTPGAVTHYSGSAAAVLCQSIAYSICFDDGQCIQHIKVHQACDAAALGISTGLL